MEASRFPGFTEKFVKLRGEMSQEQFSKKIGLSRPTVGLYESGKRIPDAQTLKKIAIACGVSADYLLGLSEIPANDPDMQSAQAFTGLSADTLSFLHEYKGDEGGPEWKMIKMVEQLLQHPAILAALCNTEETAVLISGSDPGKLLALHPGAAPEEVKMHDIVQEWQKDIKVLLFDLSNTVVDFAKEHLCVKETQKKLDKLEKELRAKVQDLLSC